MGVRHYADHITTHTGDEVRIEINDSSFGGTATKLKGTGQGWFSDSFQKLNSRKPIDSPIVKREIRATVWLTSESLINDIKSSDEGRFTFTYKKNSSVECTVFVLPDLCTYKYLEDNALWKLTIVGKDFSVFSGQQYALTDGRVTPIEVITDILSTHYSIDVYTHTSWIVQGENTAQDFFRHIYIEKQALRNYKKSGDGSDTTISLLDALSFVLRAFGCIIRQVEGKFYIQQLSALEDPTSVLQTIYNSSGVFQSDSNVDLTDTAKIVIESDYNGNPGLKFARLNYNHRYQFSSIQVPSTFILEAGEDRDFTQTIITDGSQSISFSTGITANFSSSVEPEITLTLRLINTSGDDYYYDIDNRSWETAATNNSIGLTQLSTFTTYQGSVEFITPALPSGVEGQIFLSVTTAFDGATDADDTTYFGAEFGVIDSDLNSSEDYTLTQSGQFSASQDYGSVIFGNGPTDYARAAISVDSAGTLMTGDDWATREELPSPTYIPHAHLLLRETLDLQRKYRTRISAVIKSSVSFLSVISEDSSYFFNLGGTFDGYTGDMSSEIVELVVARATDTFSKVANFESGGQSIGGTQGGGGGTASGVYFEISKNLSEGTPATMLTNLGLTATASELNRLDGDLTTVRSNLGLAIGTDVQEWDAQLQTLSGLSAGQAADLVAITEAEYTQIQNIGTSTISATQWGYLGALDQGLTTTSEVAFAKVSIDGTGLVLDSNSISSQGNITINPSGGTLNVAQLLNMSASDAIQDAGTNAIEFDGSGNVTFPGNVVMNGTTVSTNVDNLDVDDPLVKLADGNATDSLDIGWVGQRSSNNVGLIWDESADEFATILTADDGTTSGNVTIASYADFHAGAVEVASLDIGATTVIDSSRNFFGVEGTFTGAHSALTYTTGNTVITPKVSSASNGIALDLRNGGEVRMTLGTSTNESFLPFVGTSATFSGAHTANSYSVGTTGKGLSDTGALTATTGLFSSTLTTNNELIVERSTNSVQGLWLRQTGAALVESPRLILSVDDLGANTGVGMMNSNGSLTLRTGMEHDSTSGTARLTISSNGNSTFSNSLDVLSNVGLAGAWQNNTGTSLDQVTVGGYSGSSGIVIGLGATGDGALAFANSTSAIASRILWDQSEDVLKIQYGGAGTRISVGSAGVDFPVPITGTTADFSGEAEGGSFAVDATTVIDSSRNFFGAEGTFSGDLTAEANLEAQNTVSNDISGFTAGFGGSDWAIREVSSLWRLDIDDVYVRGALFANEFIINQILALNGSDIVSPGRGKIESVSGTAPNETIIVSDPQGNDVASFVEDDIVIVQQVRPDNNNIVKRLVRQVATVTGNSVLLEATTGAPADSGSLEQGDVIVAIGNTDGVTNPNRQATIYRSVIDSGAPFTRVNDNVASWADWTDSDKLVMQYGNLNGTYGYSADIYGMAIGNPTGEHATFDATNGVRFFDDTTVLAQLSGSTFIFGDSGETTDFIKFVNSGGSITATAELDSLVINTGGGYQSADFFLDSPNTQMSLGAVFSADGTANTGTVAGWSFTSELFRKTFTGPAGGGTNDASVWLGTDTTPSAASTVGFGMYSDDTGIATGAVKAIRIGQTGNLSSINTFTENRWGIEVIQKGTADRLFQITTGATGGNVNQIAGGYFDTGAMWGGNASKSSATLLLDWSNQIISLGATRPTAYNSGTGYYVDGDGKFLAGVSSGNRLQWSGSDVTLVATNAQITGTSGWLGSSSALSWTGSTVTVAGWTATSTGFSSSATGLFVGEGKEINIINSASGTASFTGLFVDANNYLGIWDADKYFRAGDASTYIQLDGSASQLTLVSPEFTIDNTGATFSGDISGATGTFTNALALGAGGSFTSDVINFTKTGFSLDTGTLDISSTGSGSIGMGSTPPTDITSGRGIFLKGDGDVLLGNTTTPNFFRIDDSASTIEMETEVLEINNIDNTIAPIKQQDSISDFGNSFKDSSGIFSDALDLNTKSRYIKIKASITVSSSTQDLDMRFRPQWYNGSTWEDNDSDTDNIASLVYYQIPSANIAWYDDTSAGSTTSFGDTGIGYTEYQVDASTTSGNYTADVFIYIDLKDVDLSTFSQMRVRFYDANFGTHSPSASFNVNWQNKVYTASVAMNNDGFSIRVADTIFLRLGTNVTSTNLGFEQDTSLET